jgi:hypothetical protein
MGYACTSWMASFTSLVIGCVSVMSCLSLYTLFAVLNISVSAEMDFSMKEKMFLLRFSKFSMYASMHVLVELGIYCAKIGVPGGAAEYFDSTIVDLPLSVFHLLHWIVTCGAGLWTFA